MSLSLVAGKLLHQTSRLSCRLPNAVALNHQQRRFLDLQEYQAKQLLYENGVQVQKFKVASNHHEVRQIIFPQEFDPLPKSRWSGFDDEICSVDEFVIKAQVLAGGRGKGHFKNSRLDGGVKLTEDRIQAAAWSESMLNDYLVTKQTTSSGVLVDRVMIAEAVRLTTEFYFAIVLDRAYDAGPILVTSPRGGMDIEEVAEQDSDAIRKFTIPIDMEIDLDMAKRIAIAGFDLKMADADLIDQCADTIIKLHKIFLKLDATQIEINPLGVTTGRQVICVDSKIKFDENAKFRQNWVHEVEEMNKHETDARDYEAKLHQLNFIGLDGSIGCLVNGAGLAMATMDIIKLHGGEPANFLDVGGGASAGQIEAAFKIINSDIGVRSILVNIFGGIMRCDTVASGIVRAIESLQVSKPIIVRLEGTRVDEAKDLIKRSNLNVIACDNMDTAAKTAVDLSR